MLIYLGRLVLLDFWYLCFILSASLKFVCFLNIAVVVFFKNNKVMC